MTATLHHVPGSCWPACVHCSAATATARDCLLSWDRHALSCCSSGRCTGCSCCHTALQRVWKAQMSLAVSAYLMRGQLRIQVGS